jgi:hypothetical protein
MKKQIIISFEIPAMLVEALYNKEVITATNGITVYPIKVDTDKKQTLLEMCLTESHRQELLDIKTLNG